VPQIISRPTVATPMPTVCMRVGISPKRDRRKGDGEQRLALHDHAGRPTGTPCAMPKACARNWPRNSVALIAISSGQDTSACARTGTARRDRKAQRRHQFRRKFVERDPARDKGKAPDHRHHDGEKDIGWLHGI
jgi:hypothetical protein